MFSSTKYLYTRFVSLNRKHTALRASIVTLKEPRGHANDVTGLCCVTV